MDLAQSSTSIDRNRNKFILALSEGEAFIDYRLRENIIYLMHTEVPSHMKNRGVGNKIVRESLNIIRDNEWKMVPWCPFVIAFLKRNNNYNDILMNR